MSEQRYAIYGETRVPVQENETMAEIKDKFATFYPEIKNFTAYTDEDGNIKFRAVAGGKG